MKFRKKPIVIEATQFFTTGNWPQPVYMDGGDYFINTLEGNRFRISEGDWIITGIKGETYACKPDIFEATYEQVEKEI